MKNIFKKIGLVLIAVFSMVSIAGCNNKNDMEKFLERISGEEANCEVVANVNMSGLIIEMTMKIDGNISYVGSFLGSPETYTEKVGDKVYTYTNEGGTWVKEETTDTNDPLDTENFNVEDFEKKDDKWVLKEDKLETYGCDELFITFEKDDVTIMTTKISDSSMGLTITATATFSKWGKVELTLPEVK